MTYTSNPENSQTDDCFLEIRDVTKMFGDFTALQDISLTVNEGEYVCFLGPSGCGKTTLLRAIAGLDFQTYGQIFQCGTDISFLPPAKRDFGIVFQSYALFPNLTVEKNVGYGLVNRHKEKDAILSRVRELLDLVGLSSEISKYPAALSGGQQQRVALARALATSPGLLLLDEPLSALDAKVRVNLRHEMKALQRNLGITTIMVTHDQEEAMALADRIIVMNDGVIEQVGTPMEIYRQPASAHVAEFIGSMNFMEGVLTSANTIRVGIVELDIPRTDTGPDTPVIVSVRPEDVVVRGVGESDANTITATVSEVEFLGSFCRTRLHCADIGDKKLTADFSSNLMRDYDLQQGASVYVSLPAENLGVYPGNGESK